MEANAINPPNQSANRGFTLVELLVTIVIIGILAAILLPTLAYAKKKVRRARCINNLKQIGTAHIGFANDNRGRLPWQLLPYLKRNHFGNSYSEKLGSLFAVSTIKSELGTAETLRSPSDPERQAANKEAAANWASHSPANPIPCEAISYSLIEGADTARPTTVLSTTRNLSELSLSEARWVGAGEGTRYPNAFANLNKNEGNMVLADGSASQSKDDDLGTGGKVVSSHVQSFGGVTTGKASTSVMGCNPAGNGTVYIVSNNGKVYALNGKTGRKKWEFATRDYRNNTIWGSGLDAPAIGANGTVYCVGGGGNIYALDGNSGAKKWKCRKFLSAHSLAIGADGTVYAGSHVGPDPRVEGDNSCKVYALDGRTGITRWEFEVFKSVTSPTIGVHGTVYFATFENVYALDGKTGAKKWKFNTGGRPGSGPNMWQWHSCSPAIGADGTVYVRSNGNKVYALDGKTGARKWKFIIPDFFKDISAPGFGSPVIGSDGTIYVGSHGKKVYALNGRTGAKKWEFETVDPVRSPPAIGSDGTFYFGLDKVYALDGKTGAKKWEFAPESGVTSPVIGCDGTVYVGSRHWKEHNLKAKYSPIVYALDGKTGAKKWELKGVEIGTPVGYGDPFISGWFGFSSPVFSDLTNSPWPMRGQNPQRTGRVMKK